MSDNIDITVSAPNRQRFHVLGLDLVLEVTPQLRYRVYQADGECIYLSSSLDDAKEAIRVKMLAYLQALSKKAKDEWYRAAFGYIDLFRADNPVSEEKKPLPQIATEVRGLSNAPEAIEFCECLENDPHNCQVHGLNTATNLIETKGDGW